MKRLPHVALALTLVLSAAPLEARAAPDWQTYQGNAEHSGYVPVTLDVAALAELWSEPVSSYALNPVAAGDGRVFVTVQIYFNATDHLFGIDGASGQVIWSKNFGTIFSVGAPAFADGNVYLQTGKDSGSPPPLFRAFDAATGGYLFQQQFSAQWETYWAPTPYDGHLYANGGYYGGMYSFDGSAPLIDWFVDLNQYDEWTPAVSQDFVYAYTGEYVPRLSIVERATGIEARSIADPGFDWNGWSMRLAPVLGPHDDIVVVQGGRLLSFDIATDTIRFELGPNYYTGQPSVAHDRIFVSASGALAVLDELTGAYLWGWAPPQAVTDEILVTDNLAFVSTASAVHAVDLTTHEEVWSHPHGGHLAWSDGILYVAGSDGVLDAIAAPESPDLFSDGFESGDTSAWSSTAP